MSFHFVQRHESAVISYFSIGCDFPYKCRKFDWAITLQLLNQKYSWTSQDNKKIIFKLIVKQQNWIRSLIIIWLKRFQLCYYLQERLPRHRETLQCCDHKSKGNINHKLNKCVEPKFSTVWWHSCMGFSWLHCSCRGMISISSSFSSFQSQVQNITVKMTLSLPLNKVFD